MKFSAGRTEYFQIGIETYKNSHHIGGSEYEEYKGICLAFGFWHVDVEWSKGRAK